MENQTQSIRKSFYKVYTGDRASIFYITLLLSILIGKIVASGTLSLLPIFLTASSIFVKLVGFFAWGIIIFVIVSDVKLFKLGKLSLNGGFYTKYLIFMLLLFMTIIRSTNVVEITTIIITAGVLFLCQKSLKKEEIKINDVTKTKLVKGRYAVTRKTRLGTFYWLLVLAIGCALALVELILTSIVIFEMWEMDEVFLVATPSILLLVIGADLIFTLYSYIKSRKISTTIISIAAGLAVITLFIFLWIFPVTFISDLVTLGVIVMLLIILVLLVIQSKKQPIFEIEQRQERIDDLLENIE